MSIEFVNEIKCTNCNKLILIEKKYGVCGPIKCIKGSYEDARYDGIKVIFYCKECTDKIMLA